MRINKNDTAAIIIDVQEKLFPFIHENNELSENIIRLIKGLKALNVDIICTVQYSKGLGATIQPIQEAIGDYTHIEKMSFSCCGSDEFSNVLAKTGKKNIIIAGIESHVCVLQTTIDLISRQYIPVLIEDCVSSRKLNDKLTAVARMRQEGALVSTYESILFELCEVSGTETFKAISKIVK